MSSQKEEDHKNDVDNQNEDGIIIVKKNLTGYQFYLRLDINRSRFKKDDRYINITITLTNLGNVTVELETYRINFPHIKIINPVGNIFTLFHGNITVAPHYEIMAKNDEISKQFNLHGYSYFYDGSQVTSEVVWEEVGNYICQGFAYNLESNSRQFEIH